MRAALLLMAGLGLLLAGCSRTVSDYSDTAVAPSTPDAQNPACPEVAGTFAIPENSAIGRVLVGRRLHDEGLSMLHIEKQSHSSVYFLRLRPTLEAFNADAAKLAENDPQRYSAWEELNRERLRAITERKSLDVLDDKIGKLGPLSEGRILAGGHGCKEYWLELDIDADAAGRYFPDVDRLGADARYEFGLLLARNADGDLIARFDRYRLRGFDLISKGLRTSRSMSVTLVSVMRAWPRISLTRRESLSERAEAIGGCIPLHGTQCERQQGPAKSKTLNCTHDFSQCASLGSDSVGIGRSCIRVAGGANNALE